MDNFPLNINGARRAEASQIEALKKFPKHFRADAFVGRGELLGPMRSMTNRTQFRNRVLLESLGDLLKES